MSDVTNNDSLLDPNVYLDMLFDNVDFLLPNNLDYDSSSTLFCDIKSISSDDHVSDSSETTLNRIKKRKLPSDFSNELVDIKVENSILQVNYSSTCDVERLMRIPWDLFGAVNTAVSTKDTKQLHSLTDALFHEKCVLRWDRSIFSMEKVGATTMKQFFDAFLHTVPDAIIMIRDVAHSNCNTTGLHLLKCKLSFTGTVTSHHLMDEFQGFKSPHHCSVEYMGKAKIPADEFENFKQKELLMRKQGLKIQIFGKMKIKFFIDSSLWKIVGYEEIFRLSSFKYVDANNNAQFSHAVDKALLSCYTA